ncbi:MAG TPA: ASKHA domain-containing protein [Phycisphaerae bacterium]|nr:ASKHA domain-containing protein [Phycisphaerae bacterium]
MSDQVRIAFEPAGTVLHIPRGVPLRDVLFRYGVEFPCGGAGRCKGCRVRLLEGDLPATPIERERLSPGDLAAGWRLACCHAATGDLTLDIEQWEAVILADETPFAFTPRDGYGVAVDLGTTTLAVQLLELSTGRVLGVRSELNPQARYGGDIMSRIEYALDPHGREMQARLIREAIGALIGDLLASVPVSAGLLREVILVGNTAMHHLFCGLDPAPLAQYPFETAHGGMMHFRAAELGWRLEGDPRVRFLPCMGSFVGSDVLAGVLATRLHQSQRLCALVDLGTNGEIVVGNRERLLCASTAAGPAFEGARIAMGMRAATGAICEVTRKKQAFHCRVIGGGAPRGICGSGLVDAVAVALDLGLIEPDGLLAGAREDLEICPPVRLNQRDIRELQLAKGAIAAGLRILLSRLQAGLEDLSDVYLAGAFGNYMNRISAWRIGLIEAPPERVRPSGNTALLGAKMALFGDKAQTEEIEQILARTEHVSLASDPEFMDIFADAMQFPDLTGSRPITSEDC